jgi:predicted phage replisome organizer
MLIERKRGKEDMYEIPWFKTETTIFSNRKIQIILKLPEGDTYFRVWIQLIALAVECNNRGRLEIGTNNPMTIQNFSKIMGKSNKKIEKILKKFLELEMLKKEGETFLIKNWDKYQSIDKYEKYQMQNRERQRKYREKHKSEIEKSNVIKMLDNEEEKNTKDIENKKEETIREENENGFRQYKI